MANTNLAKAKNAKSDEFYTQFNDIQAEINSYLDYDENIFRDKVILLPCDDPEWSNFTKFFAQNFNRFGIKKLISTSYAKESKTKLYGQLDLFEDADFIKNSEKYDPDNNDFKGKIFTLEKGDAPVDIDNLQWDYLEGDGDFRSDEVKKLRDEADIVITNPPFSMFREFIAWLLEEQNKDGQTKQLKFSIIGNLNAISYKEIFPLIKENKLWLGSSIHSGDREFGVPKSYPLNAASFRVDADGNKFIRVKGVRWYTNIEHGRRHQPLQLMTMADNLKFNKKLKDPKYPIYDNYDALEVPATNAIPSDYDGVMGVPISFLDKYCPEQFEIVTLGVGESNFTPTKRYKPFRNAATGELSNDKRDFLLYIRDPNGKYITAENYRVTKLYARILIRKK